MALGLDGLCRSCACTTLHCIFVWLFPWLTFHWICRVLASCFGRGLHRGRARGRDRLPLYRQSYGIIWRCWDGWGSFGSLFLVLIDWSLFRWASFSLLPLWRTSFCFLGFCIRIIVTVRGIPYLRCRYRNILRLEIAKGRVRWILR